MSTFSYTHLLNPSYLFRIHGPPAVIGNGNEVDWSRKKYVVEDANMNDSLSMVSVALLHEIYATNATTPALEALRRPPQDRGWQVMLQLAFFVLLN